LYNVRYCPDFWQLWFTLKIDELDLDSEEKIQYTPIGIIRTPFKKPEGTPIQPPGSEGIEGKVFVKPKYTEGLTDLEGFSHAILLYHFHLPNHPSLMVRPFLDDTKRGVFATHASSRPNPIGMSVVKIIKRWDNILFIENVDIVDNTPLLDIKPYFPEFD